MRYRLLTLLIAVAGISHAGSVLYTFDAPSFVNNSVTPFFTVAPNSGSIVGFTTTFTTAPSADFFVVSWFTPNVLFSGPSLVTDSSPAQGLTLAFSQPVTSLSFDFAVIEPGTLFLTSSAGSTSLASAAVGGLYTGGTLSFSPGSSFSAVSLYAENLSSSPVFFAMDNLTISDSAVPEPATVLSTGLAALAFLARRRALRR